MVLSILIEDLPPMLRNRSHMLVNKKGRPMNIKTPLCREFEKDLESRLDKYKSEIINFRESFKEKVHFISMEMYMYTPKDLLYKKEGGISSRAGDVDAHKVQIDTIFRCIGLDDKLVREYKITTPESHDGKFNTIVFLKLERIECLRNTFLQIQNLTKLMNNDVTSFALL